MPLREYLGDAGIAVSDIVAVSVTGATVTFFVGEAPVEIGREGSDGLTGGARARGAGLV